MSQTEKSTYFQALKSAGVKFSKHYREYTTEDLKRAWETLRQQRPTLPELVIPTEEPEEPELAETYPAPAYEPELPAQHANDMTDGEVLRVDENGLSWYQEEVRKPSFPQPRARRVIRYNDPGVVKKTVTNGNFTETFEVPGESSRPAEVKVTLPSYQVGIYRDPRFPFKIHVYNENRGFDLFEVQEFYGGADLVPDEIKRIYVENDLCFDIRTTVRAIEAEARAIQLNSGRALQ